MARNKPSRNRNTNRPANEDQTQNLNIMGSRGVKNIMRQINSMIGQSNLTLYGTDRTSEVDDLDTKFYNIMKQEVGSLTNHEDGDTTSFLSKLYSKDRIDTASTDRFVDALNGYGTGFGSSDTSTNAMNGFLETVYRNRLMEQSDLHQVSTQLIELQEAIMITRDAIISADVVEGRMNRTLSFDGKDSSDTDEDNYVAVVEQLEKRYKLLDKIKNFIVPFTLEYGNYYVYIIPYSKLFSDFMRNKRSIANGGGGIRQIGESTTILESVQEEDRKSGSGIGVKSKLNSSGVIDRMFDTFLEKADDTFKKQYNITNKKDEAYRNLKDEYSKDVSSIMERVEICNDPDMAIPFIEEGLESFEAYAEYYYEGYEDRDKKVPRMNVDRPTNKKKNLNPFDTIQQTGSVDGAYNADGKSVDENFDNIKDVYIKMIDPTRIIPVEIMDECIGYYMVYAEETTKLNGVVSSGLNYQGLYGNAATTTFIDELCERIVKSFDKKFLDENIKFKRLIVQAINYYNLNTNRVKFQFIPAEYIQEFKVDEDVDGHGQSIVKKSLFYAKMYLMLLMFKLMSIVMNSNDTKVNYVKQSGLRKDVANKVEEIIRRKQSREINMYDLYNYSSLINKIGSGSEMFVPTGRGSERPIETEILAGQEIQLNTDLMEMLKNSYILGTGVPAAIVNYLNEPEFAKIAEQNNSKYNARVVNYQLDFNPDITNMYKLIMKWATNIPQDKIDQFKFTLQPPKTNITAVKSEMIQSFQQVAEYIVRLFMGPNYDEANPDNIRVIKELSLMLAEEQLPSLNLSHLRELYEESKLRATQSKLTPNPANNDNGEDLDLGDLENNL